MKTVTVTTPHTGYPGGIKTFYPAGPTDIEDDDYADLIVAKGLAKFPKLEKDKSWASSDELMKTIESGGFVFYKPTD